LQGNSTDHPTPVTHAAGKDDVFVGRLRRDLSHPRGIDLWVVSDNVRKGAALNAVQIMDCLEARKQTDKPAQSGLGESALNTTDSGPVVAGIKEG
jgi:hypothetical protein